MSTFDFSTLNSTDLEYLVCDLWNAEGLRGEKRFKTFAQGKDAGVDLLYATHNHPHQTVGQVKHYLRSGFAKLKSDLQKNELPKINKLNPRYYKLATSLDLTQGQSQELLTMLSPYVDSIHDIYGQADLNRLLREHPGLIERHFKLWFSGTSVLKKLMQSHVDGRSAFEEDRLKKRIRLFVKTEAVASAEAILKNSAVLIITGEPGVGKTTLAEFLSYKLIKNDYEFSFIQDDIKEIEKILRNDDSQQLFYFDDFLGHNALEIARAKGSESALLRILNQLKYATNKKLILTTRSFILNTAIDESEKLMNFKLKTDESQIKLSAYTKALKLELVRNHVEESELSDDHKAVLRSHLIEDFIVRHPNFYPRSVEFITNRQNVGYIHPSEFEWFVITNFNKPDEIWRHAYERQITQPDRLLLNTLLTFDDVVPLPDLETAFLARLDYEKIHNNFVCEMHPFKHALQRLEGGFIKIDYLVDEMTRVWDNYVDFINPSLVDFLMKYVKEDKAEATRIAEATVFSQQLIKRFFPLTAEGEEYPIPAKLFNRLFNEPEIYIRHEADKLIVGLLIIRYSGSNDRFIYAAKLFASVTNWLDMNAEFVAIDYLDHLLLNETDERFVRLVKTVGAKVFSPVIEWTHSLEHIEKYRALLSVKYQFSLEDVFEAYPEHHWDDFFTTLFNATVEAIYYQSANLDLHEDEMEEKLRELVRLKNIYNALGIQVTLDITNSLGY